jgi:hypothetical protein
VALVLIPLHNQANKKNLQNNASRAKFQQSRLCGFVTCGRTDTYGHDEPEGRFSVLWNVGENVDAVSFHIHQDS